MKRESKSQQKVKDGLYKRGSSWYVRCMIDGRLYRKSCGPDKAYAQAVLAEMKKQRALLRATGEMSGLEVMFKKKDRKTFAEMVAVYMADRPHLKASTRRGYREIFDNYLLPAFGKLCVDQITEEMVEAFKADLSAKVVPNRKPKAQHLSPSRINNIVGPLRYILKVCVRRKLITDNPCINVLAIREEAPDVDPLTADELDHVLATMKPHHKALFTCLAWTGARPDELFALRWPDVDFERNEIRINKGRVRGIEGTPKSKSSKRVIHMFSIVKDTMHTLKSRAMQHVDGYIFLTKSGQPYSKHVDREWRTALKKAGLRHRPSYQLRHTFASLCLANGLQPTWIAKMLGHSTPQITFKHYARFINDASRINEARLEEFLESRTKNKSDCAQNWSQDS